MADEAVTRINAVRAARALHNIAERIVADLQETVVALDLDFRVIFWNAFAEKLHGWRADEIIGRNAIEVLAPSSREEGAELLRRMRNGEMWTGEFTVHHRDGHPIKLWASGAPLRDERGEIFGIAAFGVPVGAQRDGAADGTTSRADRDKAFTGGSEVLEEIARLTERSLSITRQGPYALLARLLQGALHEAHRQMKREAKSADASGKSSPGGGDRAADPSYQQGRDDNQSKPSPTKTRG